MREGRVSNTGGLILKKGLAAENSVWKCLRCKEGKEKRCRQGTHTWLLSSISQPIVFTGIVSSAPQSSLMKFIEEMLVYRWSSDYQPNGLPSISILLCNTDCLTPHLSSLNCQGLTHSDLLHQCNPQMFPFLGIYLWPLILVTMVAPRIFIITKFKPPALTSLLRSGHKSPSDQVDTSTWESSRHLTKYVQMWTHDLFTSPSLLAAVLIFFGKLDPVLTLPSLSIGKPINYPWVHLIPSTLINP